MDSLVRVAREFVAGAWYVLGTAITIIFDPSPLIRLLPGVDDNFELLGGDEVRMRILVLVTIMLMFVWFYRQWTNFHAHVCRRTPLHRAIQYIGWKSDWASKLSPGDDAEWPYFACQMLLQYLSAGDIKAWGISVKPAGHSDNHITPIPPKFWKDATMRSDLVMTDEPVWWADGKEGSSNWLYRKISISNDDLRAFFPKRSVMAMLCSKSPVDRHGFYHERWREQDTRYAEILRRHDTPLEDIVG